MRDSARQPLRSRRRDVSVLRCQGDQGGGHLSAGIYISRLPGIYGQQVRRKGGETQRRAKNGLIRVARYSVSARLFVFAPMRRNEIVNGDGLSFATQPCDSNQTLRVGEAAFLFATNCSNSSLMAGSRGGCS